VIHSTKNASEKNAPSASGSHSCVGAKHYTASGGKKACESVDGIVMWVQICGDDLLESRVKLPKRSRFSCEESPSSSSSFFFFSGLYDNSFFLHNSRRNPQQNLSLKLPIDKGEGSPEQLRSMGLTNFTRRDHQEQNAAACLLSPNPKKYPKKLHNCYCFLDGNCVSMAIESRLQITFTIAEEKALGFDWD
jgi:hypothetical protein